MRGSAIGWILSSQNPQTLGAQVLRLDSPMSSWVEDQNFIPTVTNKSGIKDYQAVAAMGAAHFDHDLNKSPITPVDVLMAGFWNIHIAGLQVAQKTVTTGALGAQGTWTTNALVAPPNNSGQIRSFASYTDSVTGVEMAFAGSDPYGIFSGRIQRNEPNHPVGCNRGSGDRQPDGKRQPCDELRGLRRQALRHDL